MEKLTWSYEEAVTAGEALTRAEIKPEIFWMPVTWMFELSRVLDPSRHQAVQFYDDHWWLVSRQQVGVRYELCLKPEDIVAWWVPIDPKEFWQTGKKTDKELG